jgi:hypothetical protein
MSKWFLKFAAFAAALVLGLAVVFISGGLVFGPCGFEFLSISAAPTPCGAEIDPYADEKAIYAQIYKDQGFDTNPQVIDENSLRGPVDELRDPSFVPGVSPDTLADFEIKNKESISVRPLVSDVPHMGVVTKADLEAMLPKGQHPRNVQDLFNLHYPGSHGDLSFSRVGFNRDHTQAIVYFSQWCGGLCAKGGYLLYRKKGGSWQAASPNRTMWVS